MVMIFTFVISYCNLGLFVLYEYSGIFDPLTDRFLWYIPHNFTAQWLCFWGKAITISICISNLLPYAFPVLKILISRCCCCCKRKDYKPNRKIHPEFNFERRYAQLITTQCIVCTYAYSMPIIAFVAFFVLIVQLVLDKLLITYYYKERIEHNDLLNRTAMRIIKFAIVVFYLFGALAMASNYCTVHNDDGAVLNYVNEFLVCFEFFEQAYTMLGLAGFSLICIVIISIVYGDKR